MSILNLFKKNIFLAASFFSSIFFAATLSAQTLRDPRIPNGEHLVYQVTTGNVKSTTEVTTRTQREGGKDFYFVDSRSSNIDVFFKVERASLLAVLTRTTQRSKDGTVVRETRLEDSRLQTKAGEIALVDFPALELALRGLDFEGQKSVKVHIAGTEADAPFSLVLHAAGKDTLKIGDKEWNCLKVQMSLSGIWSAVFPKTSFWLDTKEPHVLVKFEGQVGGPGTPRRVLELVSVDQKP
ncbi:MAG: DUF3108 domain-containing protein [Spirochaetia bacterium]|nr:DUF3108 domain-containing protein [Spirochaetia bacterium]